MTLLHLRKHGMQLPSGLVEGAFVMRRNRFAADVVVKGTLAIAHVPNSGRMLELLVPGRVVLLSPALAGVRRRTSYDLLLVRYQGRWVGVDSRIPPALAVAAWQQGIIPPLSAYTQVTREVRVGQSRIDLLLQGREGRCYVEVKSVNLVQDGVALFPDAPTERGVRHLAELVEMRAEGHRSAMVFAIQRDDAQAFAPYEAADSRFARALGAAADAGVEVYAIACRVTPERITPVGQVPVRLGRSDEPPA